MRKITIKFRVALFLARLGFFKYEGIHAFAALRGWPTAQIEYPATVICYSKGVVVQVEGGYSIPMAIGNAVDYARHFGGKVVPLEVKCGQ